MIVIDAKGGYDGRDTAERALRALEDVGAGEPGGRVAIWPDEVSLNLWQLAPSRLVEVLVDLVPLAKGGPAAYYPNAAAKHAGDVALRYRTLLNKLGDGFEPKPARNGGRDGGGRVRESRRLRGL